MRRIVSYGPALVVLVATLVMVVAAPAAVRRIGFAETEARVHLARASLDRDDVLDRLNSAVQNVAASVEPSVVYIAVEALGRGRWWQRSQGSGWVYDDAGHIVTNAHVVTGDGTRRYLVQFSDGRTERAELVGLDTQTDIAVLRVDTREGLFPMRRATGRQVNQGERVFAFGSPFGFKFSMTEGIVSGVARDPGSRPGGLAYTNYIQSDAAVNPGNSGGPLVDVRGSVVGMNVAIATDPNEARASGQGSSRGVSFAIPLSTIESVVGQLVGDGAVLRGFLGIEHTGNDARNAEALTNSGYRGRGVVVTGVVGGGPADRAGLRVGDVIISLNQQPVVNIASLRSNITNSRPGDVIEVVVQRRGQSVDLRVELAPMPLAGAELNRAIDAVTSFGINDTRDVDGGVLIVGLAMDSTAQREGFEPGMVVRRVDGQGVATTSEMIRRLIERGMFNGRAVPVDVVDDGGREKSLIIRVLP